MSTQNINSSSSDINSSSKFTPWIIWGLGALFFFLIYLPRVAPGVIRAELMAVFNVHGLGFGALTAFFLYAYVPMQIPVGMLYDRFGARRIISLMAIVAGIGCLVFSSAHVFHSAALGRFLTGFGGAFGFVGAMKLARDWFPGNRFGFLAGFTQALGMLGAAMGEGPISMAAENYGWRHVFFAMGLSFFVLSVLVFLFVKDKTKHQSAENCSQPADQSARSSALKSLAEVFKNKQAWLNAGYLGCTYAPVMAFAEAWGVSCLETTYHVSIGTAAFAVSLIFVGWAIGGPVMGAVSDYLGRRKPVMILSSVAGMAIFVLVLYVGPLPNWLLYVLMFFFGFTNTGVAVAYAVSGEIVTRRAAGTSIAFANMASIVLGMAFEPIIGHLLDTHCTHIVDGAYIFSPADYHYALAILPLSLIASLIFALLIKETYCKPIS